MQHSDPETLSPCGTQILLHSQSPAIRMRAIQNREAWFWSVPSTIFLNESSVTKRKKGGTYVFHHCAVPFQGASNALSPLSVSPQNTTTREAGPIVQRAPAIKNPTCHGRACPSRTGRRRGRRRQRPTPPCPSGGPVPRRARQQTRQGPVRRTQQERPRPCRGPRGS